MVVTFIPGLDPSMLHEREEWELPTERIASWVRGGKLYVAPRINWGPIDGNADHWPGSSAPYIDTSTDALMIERLRQTQHHYIVNRGYSNGYSFDIDQRGHAWVVRGFDFKCAANAQHNGHIIAVKFALGANQEPNDAMINTARLLHKESARLAGRSVAPWNGSAGWWISGHNDLRSYPPLLGRGTPTQCCGPALYRLLRTAPTGDGGELNPNKLAPPTPPPPPLEDEVPANQDYTKMRFVRPQPYANVFCVTPGVGGEVEAMGGKRQAELQALGVPEAIMLLDPHEPSARALARRAGLDPDNPREFWKVGNPPPPQ